MSGLDRITQPGFVIAEGFGVRPLMRNFEPWTSTAVAGKR
jgi:hypothetical protein